MIIINGIPVHKSVTPDRVARAVERAATTTDNPGFCIACGDEAEGVEPDAARYPCAACGKKHTVYGAELILGWIA